MKKIAFAGLLILLSPLLSAQVNEAALPIALEELTSPMFAQAVVKSGGVCVIPVGVIEKHSLHLPLGTDLYEARAASLKAAEKEYAVVFPPYYTSQIFEAKHQPGAIAYSNELQWKMLEETCDELSRNGLKKIIIFNGHGGNNSFLQYFCQSQLAQKHDYIVVIFQSSPDPEADRKIEELKKASADGHAGEEETSMMYFLRPDLVRKDAIGGESGENMSRLGAMKNGYTGIWWYSRYPNHFAGDAVQPDARLGELLIEKDAMQLAGLIKYLKENNTIEELQEEFFRRSADPLKK